MDLACNNCGGSISIQSKTGRCRKCALAASNADPAIAARRREGILRRFHSDPGVRARHQQGCKDAAQRRMQDPVVAEQMRRNGIEYGRWNFWHLLTPESRAKARVSIQAAHLSWCPREYWDLNRKLKRDGFRLAERKRIIGDEIATIEAKAAAARKAELDAMPAFERQQARLAAGGRLVETFRPRAPDPDRTLGGVASGML